jgi:hypothetical protein
MSKVLIAINHRGCRVGQSHPRAKLTDVQVERMRELREAGGISYLTLARMFEVSKVQAWRICHYEIRAQLAVEYV